MEEGNAKLARDRAGRDGNWRGNVKVGGSLEKRKKEKGLGKRGILLYLYFFLFPGYVVIGGALVAAVRHHGRLRLKKAGGSVNEG